MMLTNEARMLHELVTALSHITQRGDPVAAVAMAVGSVDGLDRWINDWERQEQARVTQLRHAALKKLTREEANAVGLGSDWDARQTCADLADAVTQIVQSANLDARP